NDPPSFSSPDPSSQEEAAPQAATTAEASGRSAGVARQLQHGTGTAGQARDEDEGEDEMEVIAKQRIRHPSRLRRTDATQQQQQQQQQQLQQGPAHAPLETAQVTTTTAESAAGVEPSAPATTTTTTTMAASDTTTGGPTPATATRTSASSPILLETVRMRREGLWAFEYWVEDAIMFMCFPVKPKLPPPPPPPHSLSSASRTGPSSSSPNNTRRLSQQGRLSFYLHDDIEERDSYESISDLPTPAPLTSSLSHSSHEATPSQTAMAVTPRSQGRGVETFGGFAGGSSFAASYARGNSAEYDRRQPRGGGIMDQTFSSAVSVRSSSSYASGAGTGGGGGGGGGGSSSSSNSSHGRASIPPYANLFTLVSASDPQSSLWRSTCYGENIERCLQMCTNEDVMMWWRERMDQTFEFGRSIERPALQQGTSAAAAAVAGRRRADEIDLEAGQQSSATTATTATTNATAVWRRLATRTRALVSRGQARQTTTENDESAMGVDAHGRQRPGKKVKKTRPFFDKRDWDQGIWRGVKVMLIKIGVREIPAPHNETMEMAMRLRGLYYCWREVTHTHLDSDDEDDGEEGTAALDGENDDDVLNSLRRSRPRHRNRRQHSTNDDNPITPPDTNTNTTNTTNTTTTSTTSPPPPLVTRPTSTSEVSVRAAIRSARNERRRRGKGKGRARMFVFDRDDALFNGKRIRGMIVAEIWIGHDEPSPEEAEEERRLEGRHRRTRRSHHSDQWANAITHNNNSSTNSNSGGGGGGGGSAGSQPTPLTRSTTTSRSGEPTLPTTTTTTTGSGGEDAFPSTLRRRRCMLRLRQGLSADVESFILATGPRLPELYEVFDHDSYHPRISRCRVMLYSIITISIFAAVFFARLATIAEPQEKK
ncbi:hypothetical protein DFQ27_009732, partial [Actinomortierella ambigua]